MAAIGASAKFNTVSIGFRNMHIADLRSRQPFVDIGYLIQKRKEVGNPYTAGLQHFKNRQHLLAD